MDCHTCTFNLIKMKNFTAFAVLCALLTGFISCTKVIGKGPIVTETRVTREFSEVDFGVPGEMVFEESDNPEIIIEAQQNIIDVIETYVSGDDLKIRVRDGKNIRSSEEIHITVRGKNVRSLAISGSGRLTVTEDFDPIDARLRVSGSGKIRMRNIISESLQVRISGSGSIEADNGTVDTEDIAISGSGDVYLQDVIAKRAKTQTSGSGNIRLHAEDELEVRISGSGDVYYDGNPVIDVKVSGSGKLVRL